MDYTPYKNDVTVTLQYFNQSWDALETSTTSEVKLLLNYNLLNTILLGIGLFLLIVVTALGNFLVGLSLFRYRSLRTISNYLIGNLALSDFLLSITILPLSSVNECLGHWIFGRVLCNIWLITDVLYCTASIWNICIIAFDRFTATFYPMWYRDKRSAKQAALYVATIWLIASSVSVPPLLGWNDLSQNYEYKPNKGVYECTIFQTPSYVLYSACGSFFVPFFITLALYVRIFGVLRQRMRRSNSRRKTLIQTSSKAGSLLGPKGDQPSSAPNTPKREGITSTSTEKTPLCKTASLETTVFESPYRTLPLQQTSNEGGTQTNPAENKPPDYQLVVDRFDPKLDNIQENALTDSIAHNENSSKYFSDSRSSERIKDEKQPPEYNRYSQIRNEDTQNSTAGAGVMVKLSGSWNGGTVSELVDDCFPSPVRNSCRSNPNFSPTSSNGDEPRQNLSNNISDNFYNSETGEDAGEKKKLRLYINKRKPSGQTSPRLSDDVFIDDYTESNHLKSSENSRIDSLQPPSSLPHSIPSSSTFTSPTLLSNSTELSTDTLSHSTLTPFTPPIKGLNPSTSPCTPLSAQTTSPSGLGSGLRRFPTSHYSAIAASTNNPTAIVFSATAAASNGVDCITRARRSHPKNHMTRRQSVAKALRTIGSIRSLRESWTSQNFEQMEMKATIRMAFIISAFCGMWLGFFTVYVINSWCKVCTVPRELEAFFFWLGYLNSTVNPVLYAIFNEEFRKAFKKILHLDQSNGRYSDIRRGTSTLTARSTSWKTNK